MKVWHITHQPDDGWAETVMICSSQKKAIAQAKKVLRERGDFVDVTAMFLNNPWSKQCEEWATYLDNLPCRWTMPGHAEGCMCHRCAAHRRSCGKHAEAK